MFRTNNNNDIDITVSEQEYKHHVPLASDQLLNMSTFETKQEKQLYKERHVVLVNYRAKHNKNKTYDDPIIVVQLKDTDDKTRIFLDLDKKKQVLSRFM